MNVQHLSTNYTNLSLWMTNQMDFIFPEERSEMVFLLTHLMLQKDMNGKLHHKSRKCNKRMTSINSTKAWPEDAHSYLSCPANPQTQLLIASLTEPLTL